MHTLNHISKKIILAGGLMALVLAAAITIHYSKTGTAMPKTVSQVTTANGYTEDHWKQILTPEQYQVLRQAATEAPFSGPLLHESRPGAYYSYGCNKPVFRSEQKYDSGTGWPSFFAPTTSGAVVLRRESNLLDGRTEVLDTCGSHLGHVFDDGPRPTGQRYCMNSIALYFVPDHK